MSPTALIIEDEPEMASLLAELVHEKGFDPLIALAGNPGLQLARDRRPDLILLDIMLPDADGFTICEALKLDRETNLIPIVMVTALGQHEDFVRGIRVGANEYVPKPFDTDDIFGAIDGAVAWRKERLEAGHAGEIHFDVKSEIEPLKELNALLASLFAYTPFSEEDVRRMSQAVMEMGMNAIEWGHRFRRDLLVRATYRIDPEKVTITIRDQGAGFDPQNLPHAARDDDPVTHCLVREALGLREGGFGMLITRGWVDQMSYNDTGNEVTLIKYFPKSKQATLTDE